MTQQEALRRLISDIEAGADCTWELVFSAIGFGFDGRFHNAKKAFEGSLDAAMALHEALLPDAWAHLRKAGKYGHCTVDLDGEEYDANNQPTPARAWLISILKAYLAELEGAEH